MALNAAVEAARGFAVVAQEVHALAERSSRAAREIDALIKGMPSEVDLSSNAVNRAGSTIVDLMGPVTGVSGQMFHALLKPIARARRSS